MQELLAYRNSLGFPVRGLLIGVVLLLSAGLAHAQALEEGKTAVLNMEGTDIRTLIGEVADKTGKNFIVDPRVKGKVTVISHRPVDRHELYQVFLSILEVHGFAAIPVKGAIKIIPDAQAKQTGTAPADGRGDEVVTRVLGVEYVDAMQLVPILRPLIPQQGHLAAYAPSNVLIISDRAENIQRLLRIIRRVDQPSSQEVEVIRLQHASAAELVRILSTLIQQKTPGKAGASQQPVLVADERTNSILLGGDKSSRLRLRAIITHLDTPTESAGNTRVVYLKYAQAADLVPVLTSVSSGIEGEGQKGGTGAGAGRAAGINIQADKSTNALVITAPPDLMDSLLAVIRQLDVRRAQVLVEAIIAEVSTTRATELGIQFRATDRIGANDSGTLGATNLPFGGSESINSVSQNPLGVGSGLTLGHFTGTAEILGTEILNLSALLRALAADDATNILSTPSLVTLDNEEAEIVVGQNVPFITGSQQTTGGLANPFQTIQRQDVGLTLKVKPQINEGNALKLEIEQEVSSVSSDATAADIITNKRSIKTSVLTDDRTIVVLGGLIEDRLQDNVSKVPLLGDIPIVGALFRNKSARKQKTNLMVFLHPVILRDSATGAKYASSKYNYLRARQLELRERGVSLMPDDVAPVLPTLGDFMELPPPFEESQSATPAQTPGVEDAQ